MYVVAVSRHACGTSLISLLAHTPVRTRTSQLPVLNLLSPYIPQRPCAFTDNVRICE